MTRRVVSVCVIQTAEVSLTKHQIFTGY